MAARFFSIVCIFQFFLSPARAQLIISGNVFDSSRLNYVENVRVVSTGGMFAVTDSLGRYSIMTNESDSLYFNYNHKSTQKFPVSKISNTNQFDISLRIHVKSRYRVLKEVIVHSKTYKQDSIENRETYADVFDHESPGIKSSVSPDGVAGADVNELINIFRFRRNKQLKAFRARLEAQEQEKYINMRFNKTVVRRITGLKSPAIDSFLVWYRPGYHFLQNSDEVTFNQYVLNCYYQFSKLFPLMEIRKEDNE